MTTTERATTGPRPLAAKRAEELATTRVQGAQATGPRPLAAKRAEELATTRVQGAQATEPGADGSGRMFDQIAPRYDMLNKLMSFGLDKRWRRKLIASLELAGPGRALDVATGTADVAIAIATSHPETQVVGLDPSEAMLEVGGGKVDGLDAAVGERITLVVGDAQEMSDFADDTFDACCISFGIRNVPDRGAGLREMARVTRTGGRVAILELAEPRSGWFAPAARFHIHSVVPRLGAWISGNAEYAYLAKSIEAFPPPEEFSELMETSGLRVLRVEPMSFGAAHLYVATPG